MWSYWLAVGREAVGRAMRLAFGSVSGFLLFVVLQGIAAVAGLWIYGSPDAPFDEGIARIAGIAMGVGLLPAMLVYFCVRIPKEWHAKQQSELADLRDAQRPKLEFVSDWGEWSSSPEAVPGGGQNNDYLCVRIKNISSNPLDGVFVECESIEFDSMSRLVGFPRKLPIRDSASPVVNIAPGRQEMVMVASFSPPGTTHIEWCGANLPPVQSDQHGRYQVRLKAYANNSVPTTAEFTFLMGPTGTMWSMIRPPEC